MCKARAAVGVCRRLRSRRCVNTARPWSRTLHEAVAAAFGIVDAANVHAETAPWALAKDPAKADRLSGVLFDVIEAIRVAAVLLAPVIPGSSAEILKRVGERTPVSELRLDRDTQWRSDGEREIIKGAALWPRSDDGAPARPKSKEIVVEEKAQSGAAAPPAAPAAAPRPAPRRRRTFRSTTS